MSTGSPKVPTSFPNFPPQAPQTPRLPFPFPQAPIPEGPTTTPPDYSDFDFSNLDLPQWGGGYTAPLTAGQIDSMRGFDVLARNNPLAQTLNYMQQQGGNIQDLGNAFRPYGSGYGTLESLAGGMGGGMPSYSDMSSIFQQAQGLTGNVPVSSFQEPHNMLSMGGNWLREAVNRADAQANVGGITDFIQQGLGGLPTMSQSFDMTEYSRNAGDVFQDQLNRQLAGIREETSGLGLNPGASDRMDRLGTAAGAATSQFNLGMQDMARQDFENMQQRNLATQGQQQGMLPTMLQAMSINPQLQQQAASLITSAAGQEGGLSSILGGFIGQNTAERQQGIQNGMQMLPFMAQLQQLPFEQQMEAYETIFNPQAGRQLEAGQSLAGLDAASIQRAMEAINQQGGLYGQNFGLGEAARGIADQDLTRAIAEFQRTQGGGFNQALGLMGQIPGMNTGFGPSSASQWGQMLAGLAGLGTGIADIYRTFR